MNHKSSRDMTSGSIWGHIFFYTIPLLLGNIFQQLYSLVDTIIVGKTIGNDALAAVGSTGPMHFLILGFVNGLTSGFAVITAQKFGAHDEKGVKKSCAMNIKLNFFSTVIFTLLSLALTKPILNLIHTPEEIFEDAFTYISILYTGIFSIVLYNTSSCLLRAIGDSSSPLFFLIVSSFLNIFLDLLFILVFHMGVRGAAWATVISQLLSGLACVFYIMKKYPILRVSAKDFSSDVWFAKKHLEIGLPMACQFSITAVGCIVLQGAINVFGAAKIAGYTAAQKTEMLFTTAAGSFGVTMANYTGQNLGAKEYNRIKKGTNAGALICGLTALAAMLIILFFWRPLSNLFIDLKGKNAADCLSAAKIYIFSTAPFYIALFEIFIYRNVLQAMGRGLMPLLAGVFELIARVIVSYTLPKHIGYIAVCLAGPLAWFAAVIPLAITYYSCKNKFLSL